MLLPNLFTEIIATLWVDPQFRGKRIATEIKGRAERWAKNQGIVHLQTGVHAKNTQMLSINEKNRFMIFQYSLRKNL